VLTSFSRIESLRPLNWDFFNLSDLSDELLFPNHFGILLVFHPLCGLFEIFIDFITNSSVFLMFKLYSFISFECLGVDLLDNSFVCLKVLTQSKFSLVHQLVNLILDLNGQVVIFNNFLLLGNNGLLTGELHLNLFLLDVLDLFDVIFLFHFPLPPDKFGSIFETHFHLRHSVSVLAIFFIDQMFFPFQGSKIQFNISLIF
jgi:hypothetical protein